MEQVRDESSDLAATASKKLTTRKYLRRGVPLVFIALVCWYLWGRYIRRVSKRTGTWGFGRIAILLSTAITAGFRLLGVTGDSEIISNSDLVPKEQHLLVWHPHGLYVVAPLAFLTGGVRNRKSPTYGTFVAVADAVFKAPLFRLACLMFNLRVADSRIMDKLLESGHSVALSPGGIHEQLATDPKQERAFFPPNLGFIKSAIKHGVPLVPLYNFGENQLYDVPRWTRTLSAYLQKNYNIGLPFGTGPWGLPMIPHEVQIKLRLGNPVQVGPANPEPTDAFVREVMIRYCVELHRVFNDHKDEALPAQIAARGLQIIWRGHESEDLSAEAVMPIVRSRQVSPASAEASYSRL